MGKCDVLELSHVHALLSLEIERKASVYFIKVVLWPLQAHHHSAKSTCTGYRLQDTFASSLSLCKRVRVRMYTGMVYNAQCILTIDSQPEVLDVCTVVKPMLP